MVLWELKFEVTCNVKVEDVIMKEDELLKKVSGSPFATL